MMNSHLVVKHDNFKWLLTCCSEGWQFPITSDISWSKMTPPNTSTYKRPFTREGNYLVIYVCERYQQGEQQTSIDRAQRVEAQI